MGGWGGGTGEEGEATVVSVECGLVWGIGLRRLGCVCGRRLGTGSYVSVRQTTTLVVLVSPCVGAVLSASTAREPAGDSGGCCSLLHSS